MYESVLPFESDQVCTTLVTTITTTTEPPRRTRSFSAVRRRRYSHSPEKRGHASNDTFANASADSQAPLRKNLPSIKGDQRTLGRTAHV